MTKNINNNKKTLGALRFNLSGHWWQITYIITWWVSQWDVCSEKKTFYSYLSFKRWHKVNGGHPQRLIARLHGGDELATRVCGLEHAVSLTRWGSCEDDVRKVSACKRTFQPPGKALSVCPPVTIDQRRIGDVTTPASDDCRWSVHLSVCTWAAVQDSECWDVGHASKMLKGFQINLFINGIFPI